MVELQSCAGLVNDPALYAIDQLVMKGENANIGIAELSAELQRERQKNAELMERILFLESQLQERDKNSSIFSTNGHVSPMNDRSLRKFKRQKIDQNIMMDSEEKHGKESLRFENMNIEQSRLVNWMSMEVDAPSTRPETEKDVEFVKECDDIEESNAIDGENSVGIGIYSDTKGVDRNYLKNAKGVQKQFVREDLAEDKVKVSCGGESEGNLAKQTGKHMVEKTLQPDIELADNDPESKKLNDSTEGCKKVSDSLSIGQEIRGNGSITSQKKPPKVAFCPKEVKRILESQVLMEKNAQSHTIRKILVFASLGIRHGCDDMYELDFRHFSILQKGEPYVSLQNPGEHVLYDKPGVRRKIFYKNHQNPTLCPVQVLEDEQTMRPSDAACPSWFFLCIKYGGTTRNLPQNEYVRQRMGRNKLKSFGPVICRMAMLLHSRTGSFFFKALGITLLFMAGFPEDIVQRETKYRNLDLLQKYYRKDEDAKGEELFRLQSSPDDSSAITTSNERTGNKTRRGSKRRRQTGPIKTSHEKKSNAHSDPGGSEPPNQFQLMGYGSTQVCAVASLPSVPPHPREDSILYHNQSAYPVFRPLSANSFVPMVYWPPPLNAFSACSYTSSYGYQYPAAGNYASVYPPPPYYNHPSCNPANQLLPKHNGKTDISPLVADTDSNSSSSSSSSEPNAG